VAKGSGQEEQAVSELVQKFLFMQQMMGGMGQDLGMLGNIPGMKNLAMARNMRRAMKSGKLPAGMPQMPPGLGGMPGMGGFPGLGGMPGMGGFPGLGGMPGMGGGAAQSGSRMKPVTRADKNARKNQRKKERQARKKGKGR
jgi:signal recognition particle subunit SRP54